jgi:hypothetical protein
MSVLWPCQDFVIHTKNVKVGYLHFQGDQAASEVYMFVVMPGCEYKNCDYEMVQNGPAIVPYGFQDSTNEQDIVIWFNVKPLTQGCG